MGHVWLNRTVLFIRRNAFIDQSELQFKRPAIRRPDSRASGKLREFIDSRQCSPSRWSSFIRGLSVLARISWFLTLVDLRGIRRTPAYFRLLQFSFILILFWTHFISNSSSPKVHLVSENLFGYFVRHFIIALGVVLKTNRFDDAQMPVAKSLHPLSANEPDCIASAILNVILSIYRGCRQFVTLVCAVCLFKSLRNESLRSVSFVKWVALKCNCKQIL